MGDAVTDPLEAAKLELDRKKFEQDTEFRKREIDLKNQELKLKSEESKRSRIFNPLVIAVAAAAIGALGTAFATYYNGNATERLEAEKAESERILAVIKTDPLTSAANLQFLVRAGLIVSPKTVATIQALKGAPTPDAKLQAPSIPSLPSSRSFPTPDPDIQLVCDLNPTTGMYDICRSVHAAPR